MVSRILRAAATLLLVAILLWIAASFIEVNAGNLAARTTELHPLNFFELILTIGNLL